MTRKIVVTEGFLDETQKKAILDTAEKYGFSVTFFSSPAEAEAAGALADAEILYGGGLAPYISKAPKLKWVCSSWAGVDPYCKPGVMPEDMLLTGASGAFGVTLSEYAVMVTLMLLRRHQFYDDAMRRTGWREGLTAQRTIKDSRITLLGAGDIGQHYAKLVRAFEPAKITAVSRSGKTSADCFDAIVPISEIETVLPETDILMMSLPSTPETEDILNRERIALLPKQAYVINVGRGSNIDEAALVDALNEERIAGAALDVMKHEPMPADDPLRTAKNILLTPHIAGNMTAPHTRNKNVAQFCEDIANYTEGRPLTYLVDRKRGY